MTLHRRDFIALGLGAAALAGAGPALAIEESDATTLVQSTIDELTAILTTGGDAAARAASLQSVMERRANMPQIAKFSAGRVWLEMSPEQQTRYQAAFAGFVATVYARRFDEIAREPKITIGKVVNAGKKGMLVETAVDPAKGETISVDWLVSDRSGRVEIVDMVVEGISMATTQREEIAAMYQSNGGDIDALIVKLESPPSG